MKKLELAEIYNIPNLSARGIIAISKEAPYNAMWLVSATPVSLFFKVIDNAYDDQITYVGYEVITDKIPSMQFEFYDFGELDYELTPLDGWDISVEHSLEQLMLFLNNHGFGRLYSNLFGVIWLSTGKQSLVKLSNNQYYCYTVKLGDPFGEKAKHELKLTSERLVTPEEAYNGLSRVISAYFHFTVDDISISKINLVETPL